MPVEVAPLPFKPPQLKGLSDRLLVSHYENNYGGAVRRLNAIDQHMTALDWAAAPGFALNGLARERLIAANSMLLHEAYFDGLGGVGGPAGAIATALERDFGSVDRWQTEFAAMGKALGGGSGWVLLTWSDRLGRLTNQWAADHCHVLAGGVPVLALDMYEHAYHIDFGANAAAYVDAFLGNINWEGIERRYRGAVGQNEASSAVRPDQIGPTALRAMLARAEPPVVLDVCADEDRARRYDTIPGARVGTPGEVAGWVMVLPTDRPVIVACTYGFEKSGNVVTALRNRGCDARQLAGGMAAWHAMGAPTEPLAGKA
ncbi:MAG: hypothetical protein M0Z28_00895 [Rhodospirillales bacterium]|nr:hypothetical protein [Rhodospirillales bacterium]